MLCYNQEKVSIYGISKLHDNVLSHNSGLILLDYILYSQQLYAEPHKIKGILKKKRIPFKKRYTLLYMLETTVFMRYDAL